MSKKKTKKTKTEKHATTFTEALGVNKIFDNERLNFFIGVLLLILAAYTTMAFISFFTTGAADQSIIEELREGELANQQHEFSNSCGSMGAYLSWYAIKRCFGIPAFLIPLMILITALHLIKAYKAKLLKWFMALMVIMVWASITMAKFVSPLFAESHFNPGGDHGQYICQLIEGYIGTPGLTAVLALVAIAFLTYISAETILIIRNVLNPSGWFKKVPFIVTNNNPDEPVPSYEDQIVTEEDPEVFDDPSEQVVEFPIDGKPRARDGFGEMATRTVKTEVAEDPGFKVEKAKVEETADGKELVQVGDKELEPYDPKRDLENYHYPTLDLLKKYDNDGKPYIDMDEQTKNKNRIVEVLRTFGVEISTIKATVGPTITLYEITLAPGVRISKIRSLEDDIALSLSALGIRIIAPIPRYRSA